MITYLQEPANLPDSETIETDDANWKNVLSSAQQIKWDEFPVKIEQKRIEDTAFIGTNHNVCYLHSAIQSQPSTRLDVDDIKLIEPHVFAEAYKTIYRGMYRGLPVKCKVVKKEAQRR